MVRRGTAGLVFYFAIGEAGVCCEESGKGVQQKKRVHPRSTMRVACSLYYPYLSKHSAALYPRRYKSKRHPLSQRVEAPAVTAPVNHQRLRPPNAAEEGTGGTAQRNAKSSG